MIGGLSCLASLALALWFISTQANQTLANELARQAFEGRAHLTLAELERLRDTARAGAEALAANPIVDALTSEERGDRIPALAATLRATPGLSAAYVGWPDGDFLLLRQLGEPPSWVDAPEGAAWLVQWIEGGTPRFEFLDTTLASLAERREVRYDLDPVSRPWFIAAQSTTDTVVTMPYVFFTTREPGLTAARQASGGAVAGVDISLVDLSARLSGFDQPSSIISALLDRNGGVVAYSDLERISEMMAEFSANADPRETALPPAEDLGEPILAALADEVRTGNDRFFRAERIAGVPWLILAHPIDDQGTTLVVHAPRSAFASVAQDIARNLLVLFVTVTVVALGLLALVARQVARPVEAMAREVDLLGTLDFRSGSRVRSHVREFSRLGDAFAQMKTTLANYTDVLKDTIRQYDHDALIRSTLARLQAITEAERAVYWSCQDGRLVHEPMHDTGRAEAGLGPAQIPPDLPERICALASVAEITLAEQGEPTGATASSANRRILAIPLHSEDNRSIGAIAVLCRPGAPALEQQVMAIAEATSNWLGLVIERRRLLGEHQAARRQSELILAAVADGIHVLDTEGRIIEQNEAARSMLGWTADEVRGRHSHALIHHHRPDGKPYPVEECPIFQTLADGRTRAASDEYFFCKDGRGFPVEFECSAIRDDGGAISGAVVSFRDLTERLSAQRRLRERVKELNCLYRVLELTLSSTRTIPDVCAEIAQLLPESLLHESIASARIRVNANEYRSPDWQPPATSLRAEIYNGTNIVGFVEVSYDEDPAPAAFDPHDAEAPFLRDEDAMIKAVASHVGRMIDARQIAERLTQTERLTAVGELTGGIAHDFNNLLTVVIGSAEVLEDRLGATPAEADLVRMIRTAAERGADLTHRLLAFSRRQPLSPRTVDAEGLIRSMTQMMQRTLGEANEIELVAAPGLWPVTIDPVQLESAVLNLAINARDAMPDGGRLTIELSNVHLDEPYADWNDEVTPGSYVLLAITDTGTGMGEEVLRRVFEPFFSTKEPGRGNGLGLSMVYGFVKQSRGHVRIYSEPGQGTTVRLYLPRAKATSQVNAQTGLEPDKQGAPTGQERVLLVEDDHHVRDHTTRLLEGMGYTVQTAPDAPFALDLVQKGLAFDILFTDLVMPGGMNGYELARAVRAIRPGVAVLCTSGYADLAVIRETRLAPDMVFLSKPYRRMELAGKIRMALEVQASVQREN